MKIRVKGIYNVSRRYYFINLSICSLSLGISFDIIPHIMILSTLSYLCITQFLKSTILLESEISILLSIFKILFVASPIISNSLSMPRRNNLLVLYSLKSHAAYNNCLVSSMLLIRYGFESEFSVSRSIFRPNNCSSL
jgi:hypothetical protein